MENRTAGEELFDDLHGGARKRKASVMPKVKQFLKLQAKMKKAEEAFKAAKQDCIDVELETFGLMEEIGMQSLSIDGKMVYRNPQKHFSIIAENKEGAYEFLRENGFDGLFYETVNARTLNTALKDFEESGGEIPDTLISFHVTPKLGVRKAK